MRQLLPVALFVIPFGLAFGAAAAESGLHPAQSIALSILTFSGAAQFATLDFWYDPIAFGSLALVTLALNARHVIMGAALSPWVGKLSLGLQLMALIFLSDPNFAYSPPRFRDGERDIGVLVGGGLVLWLNWVLGTILGAFGGSQIDDPGLYGIDVVMLCFFAAITTDQFRNRSTWLPAGIAAGVAVLTLGMVPTGWNIILGALAGGTLGVIFHAK
jgi:predicted branched-subunit amino acid permease